MRGDCTKTILSNEKKALQHRVQHKFLGGSVVALEPCEEFLFPYPVVVGWSVVLAGVRFFFYKLDLEVVVTVMWVMVSVAL